MSARCVFCDIVSGREPAKVRASWPDALAITPLNPVTSGHVLVLPRLHVRDAAENPALTGATMVRAAEFARYQGRSFNIITSAGVAATQTVLHLHLHVVPRVHDDGLALPWTARG